MAAPFLRFSMGEQRAPTVLIVDNSHPFSALIGPALTRRGYSVYCANNAVEGRTRFQEHGSQIDLVVIDILMPGAANFDFAAELERLRTRSPVLYLVGSQPSIARAGIEAQSPASVLVAPFTEEEFMARVGDLLDPQAALRPEPDERLWDRLMEASDGISSGATLLYIYESRHASLAAAQVAMLRAGGVQYAFRRTNSEDCPYSVVVPARDAARARSLIAEISHGNQLNSAA
jgi:CheY-like chemotaxis protein